MATTSVPIERPEGDPIHFETISRVTNYRYVGGEVRVRAADRAEAVAILQRGLELSGDPTTDRDGISVIFLLNPSDVPDAVDSLIADGIPASPHHVYVLAHHTQWGPADAPRQLDNDPPGWAAEILNLPSGQLATGPTIAIVDTGILGVDETPLPAGAVAQFSSLDPVPPGGGPKHPLPPYVGHGTFVAGRVLQTAQTARIVMVRPLMEPVADADGSAVGLEVSDDQLAVALARAVVIAGGVDPDLAPGPIEPATAVTSAQEHASGLNTSQVPVVLNLSLSGRIHDASAPFLGRTRAVLDVFVGMGTKIVAAAGNSHSFQEHFPGAYDDVICVGATNEYGQIADFSNSGPWVDIYAPGVDVVGWYLKSPPGSARIVTVGSKSRRRKTSGPWAGYAEWSGTSFAAPYVAGLLAK